MTPEAGVATPSVVKSTAREPWILAATIIASSMAFIDMTVVNVALPVLQRGLGATFAEPQWVVEAYTLLLSVLVLAGGTLGGLYGRRRCFSLGVVIFVLASGACGLAPSPAALIVARAVQGMGSALLMPGSLAIPAAFVDSYCWVMVLASTLALASAGVATLWLGLPQGKTVLQGIA